MSNLNTAIIVATDAHNEQIDKGGNSYILHPLRVMFKMTTNEERIVAVLHDVIEDTRVTPTMLSELGFSQCIVSAIVCLSRYEESYMDFIRRCKQNELARKVKIADIEDNMDLSRIPNPTKDDLKRIKKYEKALKELL